MYIYTFIHSSFYIFIIYHLLFYIHSLFCYSHSFVIHSWPTFAFDYSFDTMRFLIPHSLFITFVVYSSLFLILWFTLLHHLFICCCYIWWYLYIHSTLHSCFPSFYHLVIVVHSSHSPHFIYLCYRSRWIVHLFSIILRYICSLHSHLMEICVDTFYYYSVRFHFDTFHLFSPFIDRYLHSDDCCCSFIRYISDLLFDSFITFCCYSTYVFPTIHTFIRCCCYSLLHYHFIVIHLFIYSVHSHLLQYLFLIHSWYIHCSFCWWLLIHSLTHFDVYICYIYIPFDVTSFDKFIHFVTLLRPMISIVVGLIPSWFIPIHCWCIVDIPSVLAISFGTSHSLYSLWSWWHCCGDWYLLWLFHCYLFCWLLFDHYITLLFIYSYWWHYFIHLTFFRNLFIPFIWYWYCCWLIPYFIHFHSHSFIRITLLHWCYICCCYSTFIHSFTFIPHCSFIHSIFILFILHLLHSDTTFWSFVCWIFTFCYLHLRYSLYLHSLLICWSLYSVDDLIYCYCYLFW